MAIQCCVCYRVKEVRESEVTWKKVRDAAIVSRTAKLVFCPECEQKSAQKFTFWQMITGFPTSYIDRINLHGLG